MTPPALLLAEHLRGQQPQPGVPCRVPSRRPRPRSPGEGCRAGRRLRDALRVTARHRVSRPSPRAYVIHPLLARDGLAGHLDFKSAAVGLDGAGVNALQIEDLFKRYPTGTEALRGVSLEIEDGEFFGLLGPNGAGKSTLIHCTTGLAQPTSGSIQVFGHDAIDHYEQARLAVGLAPQDLNLDWFLTARGDARLPRRLLRDAQEGAPGAHGGAARRVLAHREARRPHAHAVGRHEAAAGPRARADAPAAAADPRRAHRRRRRGAAARAVAVRAAHQRGGHHDPPHHALPRGGRAAV